MSVNHTCGFFALYKAILRWGFGKGRKVDDRGIDGVACWLAPIGVGWMKAVMCGQLGLS